MQLECGSHVQKQICQGCHTQFRRRRAPRPEITTPPCWHSGAETHLGAYLLSASDVPKYVGLRPIDSQSRTTGPWRPCPPSVYIVCSRSSGRYLTWTRRRAARAPSSSSLRASSSLQQHTSPNSIQGMDDPPSVLVGSGPLDTGPFYLIIANVPEGTTWQHVKDFVKSQVDLKRLDMYVNLHGARMDSGWIRVIGYKAFRQIKSTCSPSLRGHVPAWHAVPNLTTTPSC